MNRSRLYALSLYALLAISVSGCIPMVQMVEMGTDATPNYFVGDTAFMVHFKRPPADALVDLKDYLTSQNFKIDAASETTFRTEPGEFLGSGSGLTVRMVMLAEPTPDGSNVTVKVEYLDPASGAWASASSKKVIGISTYDHGEMSPSFRAYEQTMVLLQQRYGTASIKYVKSTLAY